MSIRGPSVCITVSHWPLLVTERDNTTPNALYKFTQITIPSPPHEWWTFNHARWALWASVEMGNAEVTYRGGSREWPPGSYSFTVYVVNPGECPPREVACGHFVVPMSKEHRRFAQWGIVRVTGGTVTQSSVLETIATLSRGHWHVVVPGLALAQHRLLCQLRRSELQWESFRWEE